MKRSLLTCIILFFGVFMTAFSQKGTNKLAGVWQFCSEIEQENGVKVMACSPIWKVLQADGKFCQFILAYKDGMCALTHEGTYEINSDNTYTEHISQHAVDKKLIGTNTVLEYRFVNDDMVVLTFKLQDRKDEFREIWKRVKPYVEKKK